jgi:hypothetical protein
VLLPLKQQNCCVGPKRRLKQGPWLCRNRFLRKVDEDDACGENGVCDIIEPIARSGLGLIMDECAFALEAAKLLRRAKEKAEARAMATDAATMATAAGPLSESLLAQGR